MQASPARAPRAVTVRTITAGIALERLDDVATVARVLDSLARARQRFESEGYDVQTTRLTLPPLVARVDATSRGRMLDVIRALDTRVASAGARLGLGPILLDDRLDDGLASFAAELVRATTTANFSVVIASPGGGMHVAGAETAARVTRAVAEALPNGAGSFRFAAAANVPAGTPFFPVGWHDGPTALAIGLQSANLVRAAFDGAADREDARQRLTNRLTSELREVERIASELARAERVAYRGIDTSPAPIGDESIGAAIETLTRVPFGSAGTLSACALITDVIKSVPVRRCGYCGLMLPVLEDAVLARRAAEGRFGVRELLLFSSVCGTGLDVVPIPGDTPLPTIANIMRDVAAQSVKLGKALSVRLFPVAGKVPGDAVHFDDPLLTDSVVLPAT